MKKPFVFFFLMLAFLASCVPAEEIKKDTSAVSISEDELPRTIAILPFLNETPEVGISNQIRRSFANHFSGKAYRDIKLPIVDEKSVQLEKSTGKSIVEIAPAEVCQAIGCDGIVYGRVIDYKKVYAGVYSQLGAEAEVWMVNAKTGKEIFRIRDAVRYHEGGVPMSPVGIIMTAVSTAMNLRDIQQVRMVNELCYKFNEKIPSPKGIAKDDAPVIKEVLTNIKEGPFGKGKVVRVGLEGEPGAVATFDIGNFKKGVLMRETKPGIYMGEYLVLPGDNSADMPIIASLKRPGGNESQWVDVSGFVSIDTAPPPQIKGLRAKGYPDRIELTWEPVKNVSDLAGYRVLRSEQPLSGFTELAKIEQPVFEDKNAKADSVFYYKIVAFDATGNDSENIDSVKASLISGRPVLLSGEFKKDTILSGNFIVKDSISVPKGISLSIEPDTRIVFEDNASFTGYGKITVNAKDAPVEFIGAEGKKWRGISINGGILSMNGFRIKGAETGISSINTEGSIENGAVSETEKGLLISGVPAVSLKNMTVSNNKSGVLLIKSNSIIKESNIFQNERGMVLQGFSGEISESNIHDNAENIASDAPVKIGANYFGSTNIEEMKLKGVSVAKVYNDRYPSGKIVDAVSDPYASLSQDERQKKAAEFLIEAGGFFRQRNYGKASNLFENALKAHPSPDTYYYLALCYQEMKEDDKAMKYLEDGVKKFPNDSTIQRAIGFMHYQRGNEAEAKKAFLEVIRLSPDDRQVKFLLERIGK
ncbi:MAG: tetratricopeptide repeat protein [Nitrospirae bacterium]|nr:MAG: tetratricopeptide repeat protein [Nitrospirota bacterium]